MGTILNLLANNPFAVLTFIAAPARSGRHILFLGSARLRRAVFGVAPKTSSNQNNN